MRMGPVAQVRRNSPAQTAGFMEGDVILKVAGEKVADPLLLDEQLKARLGQPVTVTVARTNADSATHEIDLVVTPAETTTDGEVRAFGLPTATESIGLAYFVTDVVDHVVPGSAADAAGIQPGDHLVDFVMHPASDSKISKSALNDAGLNRIELQADRHEWPALFWSIQHLPSDVDVEFIFDAGGLIHKFTLTDFAAMENYLGNRGLQFEVLTDTRTADTWSEAVRLGLRETRAGVEQVVFILRNIGALYRNIGGPLAIASVGTQEASAGLPRLLIFLTMLSANLAVLNFLPIPVLDGGHMLFLIYEGLVGKPVNERVAMGLTMAGLCFILTLMVIVFGWDIYRIATG
jgi:regulator of sigma E protease